MASKTVTRSIAYYERGLIKEVFISNCMFWMDHVNHSRFWVPFNNEKGHKTQTFGYFETFLYFDKAFFETLRQESL